MPKSDTDIATTRPARPPVPRNIRDHRDLRVWRRAVKLMEEVEKVCAVFPAHGQQMGERLTATARSVPELIQEGQAARVLSVYLEFVDQADRTLQSLEQSVIKSYSAGWVAVEAGDRILMRVAELRRMLKHLHESLQLARLKRRGTPSGS